MPTTPHISLILSAAVLPLLAVFAMMAHYWASDIAMYVAVTERAKLLVGSPSYHQCSVVVCILASIPFSATPSNCSAPDYLLGQQDDL